LLVGDTDDEASLAFEQLGFDGRNHYVPLLSWMNTIQTTIGALVAPIRATEIPGMVST
jgi:hypothetical protein